MNIQNVIFCWFLKINFVPQLLILNLDFLCKVWFAPILENEGYLIALKIRPNFPSKKFLSTAKKKRNNYF